MAERVCIFIDGSNFYHGLKASFLRTDLSFERFVEWLAGDRKLVRTYYYNATVSQQRDPERYRSQQRFFQSLSRIPYFSLRLGRLEPRGSTFVEKGVDIAIAVDMLSMAFSNVYDTAILVSSDGDFARAIEAVCNLGKHVEAVCFPKAYGVRQAADKAIVITACCLSPLWQQAGPASREK